MKSKNKELFNNTALFALSSLVTKLIAFLMVPFYTYMLTTQEFGTIDVVFTTLNLLLPIFTLCIHQATLRFTLELNSDKKLIFSYSLLVVFIGIGILTPISFLKIDKLGDCVFLSVILFASNFIYCVISEFVRGMGEIRCFVVGNILVALISIILNIVTIAFLHWGVNGYILSFCIAYSIAILYYVVRINVFKYLTLEVLNRKNTYILRNMLKYSVFLIPNTLFWWITNASDRYLILHYLGMDANGIYAVSNRVPVIITSVCGIFVQAWTLTAIKERGSKDNTDYNEAVFQNIFSFTFIISSAVLLVLKPFIHLYVPKSYYSSWESCSFLIMAATLNVIASFIGTRYIVEMKNLGNMISTMIGAITNILFNIILIPYWGIVGAAIATYTSYLIVIIYRIFDTKKFKYQKKITELSIKNITTWIVINLQTLSLFINDKMFHIFNLIAFIIIVLINKRIITEILGFAINYIGRKGIRDERKK